jgi:hypothetical protein
MKKLKQLLKWIVSSLCAAIIGYIVWKYIDSIGSIQNLLIGIQDSLLQLLNLPTPLWATIALVLLCGTYIYIKHRQYQSSYTILESKLLAMEEKIKVLEKPISDSHDYSVLEEKLEKGGLASTYST